MAMRRRPSSVAVRPQLPRVARLRSFAAATLACNASTLRRHISLSPTENRGSMLYDAYEVQRSFLAGASKLAGMGAGWLNNPVQPMGLQLDGAAGRGEPRGVRPCLRAARQARFGTAIDDQSDGKDASRSTRRSCCASRSASSSISAAKVDRGRARALLIVAPMSGHYATLLRGTVERLLPDHRRLHHRLARREAGAADGGQLRSRRLYRLSDRVPRAHRREAPASGRICSRCASRRCRPSPRPR